MDQKDEVLAGGIDSNGKLVRRGERVIRPAGRQSASVHRLLRHLRQQQFTGAPEPVEILEGKEHLLFVEGTVPEPPYPAWYFSDDVLISLGKLIRGFHDAGKSFVASKDDFWKTDLADPSGSGIVCHNDIGPGNVVFQNMKPVAIIDFDYAAPGRPIWDIARSARNWIPLDHPQSAETYGMSGLDSFARLRLFTESYGMTGAEKSALLDVIEQANLVTEKFVKAQVDAGRQAFVKMWQALDLGTLYEKRRQWFDANKKEIARILK